MTTTSPINEAERARRSEYVRDSKGALLKHETMEARTKRREAQADQWSIWFRTKMDETGCSDPVALLPDAFARLELFMEDKVNIAINELKTVLKGALK